MLLNAASVWARRLTVSRLSKFYCPVLLFLVLILLASLCWAQKDTGNIVGTVKDKSGAVLPSVKVAVEDVERGTVFRTTSNGDGEFSAGPLKPGRYRVIVEKGGFKKTIVGPIDRNAQRRQWGEVVIKAEQVKGKVQVT